MTDAEDRITLFELLIKEHGDPNGAYHAAIEYIQNATKE